jgi:hypothetical protein
MREALSELLGARYPVVFGTRRYFEVNDGWFGLLDALSEVLTAQAQKVGM